MALVEREELRRAHDLAIPTSQVVSLPFRSFVWRGSGGTLTGSGTGSSIDFQDQRAYQPGDDPRSINWSIYARSKTLSLKMYRNEVSPYVEVIFDCSLSMLFNPEKRLRSLELLYFCLESAAGLNVQSRVHLVSGEAQKLVMTTDVLQHNVGDLPLGQEAAPNTGQVEFRYGSLRILISDLLFPGPPASIVQPLASRNGKVLMLVPYCSAETDPDWHGNVKLIDCETLSYRVQAVDGNLKSLYRNNYQRHFELWAEEAKKSNVSFARIASEASLGDLFGQLVREGTLELCN